MKKFLRIALIAASVFYALALIYLLFLNNRYIRYTNFDYFLYLRTSINLIPFKTVYEYITRIQNETINLSTALKNLFGNLAAFFPAGIFLPCIFKKLRRFWKTVLTVFCIVLAAEILQLLLCLGSFDIDDLILNLAGAMLGYGFFRLPPVQKLVKYIDPEPTKS